MGSTGFVCGRLEESTETQPRHVAGGCAQLYIKTVIGARQSAAIGREEFTKMGNIDSKGDFEVKTATQGRQSGVERKRKSCWDSDSSSEEITPVFNCLGERQAQRADFRKETIINSELILDNDFIANSHLRKETVANTASREAMAKRLKLADHQTALPFSNTGRTTILASVEFDNRNSILADCEIRGVIAEENSSSEGKSEAVESDFDS